MSNPHQLLLKDLASLLKDASEFHFHDFKAPGNIATPKVDLVNRLHSISESVKSGRYDDDPDENDVAELLEICEKEGMPEEMIKILGLK